MGKLIFSPTRTYLPVLREVFARLRPYLHGIIHYTGGGQTKVLKFVKNRRVIKDNLFALPPLFSMIQASSSIEGQEMYQVYNMGHRMEVYLAPEHAAEVITIAEQYGNSAQIVGRVEAVEREHVRIEGDHCVFRNLQ